MLFRVHSYPIIGHGITLDERLVVGCDGEGGEANISGVFESVVGSVRTRDPVESIRSKISQATSYYALSIHFEDLRAEEGQIMRLDQM